MLFWFLTAPAIGFIGNIPELLAILSIWLFSCNNSSIQNFSKNVSGGIKYYILVSVALSCFAIKSTGIKRISLEGWMPIKERVLVTKETLSDLKVLTPSNRDQC